VGVLRPPQIDEEEKNASEHWLDTGRVAALDDFDVLRLCGAQQAADAPGGPDGPGAAHAVLIKVGSSVANENAEQDVVNLRGLLLARVTLGAQYQTVALAETTPNPPPDALLVTVTITRLRHVSSAGRFWGGALAGRASLTAEVRIARNADGKELGLYTVTGESGRSGFSGGTEDAVNKAALAIAALLRKNPPTATPAPARRAEPPGAT
jgi:hypothetical protein